MGRIGDGTGFTHGSKSINAIRPHDMETLNPDPASQQALRQPAGPFSSGMSDSTQSVVFLSATKTGVYYLLRVCFRHFRSSKFLIGVWEVPEVPISNIRHDPPKSG